MSIKIKTWRDPYDAGFSPTRPKEIELNSGITVLVGCNGAGKSTLINNIESEIKDKIPCCKYNNMNHGGFGHMFESAMYHTGDYDMGTAIFGYESSEGECIKLNINTRKKLYDEFIKTGFYNDSYSRMLKIFAKHTDNNVDINKRVLLFDATDSGLSVDSVIEIKHLLNSMLEYAQEIGIELYIIISANEYELVRNSNCFDVNSGKYITFSDYEDYRKFIIKSRKKKEKRIQKQHEWQINQLKKEYCDNIKLIKKLENNNNDNNYKWKLHRFEKDLEGLKKRNSDIIEILFKNNLVL